jgi:hypothetical protein
MSLDAKEIVEHSSLFSSDEKWWSYKEKIDSIDKENITSIRVCSFNNNMVRVYIKTETKKDQITITFGSKKIDTKLAFENAMSVIEEIKKRHNDDTIKYFLDQRLSATGGRPKVTKKTLEGKRCNLGLDITA